MMYVKIPLIALFSLLCAGCVIPSDRTGNEGKAFLAVLKRYGTKQYRRFAKDQLEKEFRADPSMAWEEREEKEIIINSYGREELDQDEVQTRVHTREARDQLLDPELAEKRHGEEPIPLVKWGLIEVDDEGSIRFNIKRLTANMREWLRVGIVNNLNGSSMQKDTMKTSAGLRMNFRPMKTFSNPVEMISKYTLRVTTDHYAKITGKHCYANEYEFQVTDDGQVSFFWSLVVPFRR